MFGKDDVQGYLDKYAIAESIEDGTTVPLNYTLAPSGLQVDRKILEQEFLSLAEAEGISDPDELNAILDRAVNLKVMMKAPDRVNRIGQHVAQHFRENVEPMGIQGRFWSVWTARRVHCISKHSTNIYQLSIRRSSIPKTIEIPS